MNIKNAVREFLRGETRQSRRLEAVRFIRRYSDGTRPVTHYRLHGASVEAVPALLKAAGLKESEDFSVMVSDNDPSIAKLVWLCGGHGDEFASACASQGLGVFQNGLTFCESAYAAILRKEADDVIAACFAEAGEDAAEEEGDGGSGNPIPLATMASTITARIVESVREYLANQANVGSLSPNESSMYESLRIATSDTSTVNSWFMPPLFVIEFYVRRVLGLGGRLADEGGPADSIFAPYTGSHAYARPIVRQGEPAVLPHLLDAPLFELVENNSFGSDAMDGYVSNNRKHIEANPKCKAIAVIGNSRLMLDYGPCPDKVAVADYMMNRRYDFWNYLRKIYSSAFGLTVNAEIMSISRIGIRNDSTMLANHRSVGDDCEPTIRHIDRITDGLNALLMYGVVLSYEGMNQPMLADGILPGAAIGVESKAAVPPEFAKTRLTKEELPAEWFVMTHCDGTEFGDSLSDYGKAERESMFARAFRPFVKGLLTEPNMQKWCRGDNPSFVPVRYGATVFHAMSSLVSCVVASIKELSTFQEGATFVHRKGLAKGDALRDAVVAGVFSGVSTDLAPVDCDATKGVFPKVESNVIYDDDPFDGHQQLEGRSDRFSAFMDALHADPTLQLRMARRSAGSTRRYNLVIETNLTADVLTDASDDERMVFQERMRGIVAWSLALRYADPFRVLSGEPIAGPMNHVVKAITALSIGGVSIEKAFSNAGFCFPTFRATSFIDNYVRVGWRADAANRLHIILGLRGDGAQLARTIWRSLAGLPAESAELAKAAWTPANDARTVYATDRGDAGTAAELVRKGIDVLGVCTEASPSLIPFGGFVPMVGPTMSVVAHDTYPGRAWFTSYGAYAFDPCSDVRLGQR